ncbi:hypothetical protein N9064_00500 [bacterium]|nr:hypothetical protein [bacterium]
MKHTIPKQTALDTIDKILELCCFEDKTKWNAALDLRNELKEFDERG